MDWVTIIKMMMRMMVVIVKRRRFDFVEGIQWVLIINDHIEVSVYQNCRFAFNSISYH